MREGKWASAELFGLIPVASTWDSVLGFSLTGYIVIGSQDFLLSGNWINVWLGRTPGGKCVIHTTISLRSTVMEQGLSEFTSVAQCFTNLLCHISNREVIQNACIKLTWVHKKIGFPVRWKLLYCFQACQAITPPLANLHCIHF